MANEDYNYSFMEEQELDEILAAQAESAESCRTRATRRRQRELHIERKEKFLKKRRQDNMPTAVDASDIFYYNRRDRGFSVGHCEPACDLKVRGSLAKGKIHKTSTDLTMQDVRNIWGMILSAADCPDVGAGDLHRLRAAASL